MQNKILDFLNRDDLSLMMKKNPIESGFSRNDLADLFLVMNYKVGVEVGIERGIFSETLIKNNPNLRLYGVDPLEPYRGYREHVSKEKMDGFYNEVVERMKPYNYTIIRKYSMDAVKDFKDGSLDFVYIDGNHDFLNTTLDICHWYPKVRSGGILAGHDFVRNKKKDYKCHVKDVVCAYTYANDIRPWFVTNLDKSPSWFWVKQ